MIAVKAWKGTSILQRATHVQGVAGKLNVRKMAMFNLNLVPFWGISGIPFPVRLLSSIANVFLLSS